MSDCLQLKAIVVVILACFALAGCDSKLASVSDADLQDKAYQCDTQQSQSPGFAITCDNYRRECKARREEGRFVC
jgi:hypothetical protein